MGYRKQIHCKSRYLLLLFKVSSSSSDTLFVGAAMRKHSDRKKSLYTFMLEICQIRADEIFDLTILYIMIRER